MQEPAESPNPVSQAVQADALVHVVQPDGQEVHEEAPTAEKVPVAQATHALVPPAEN